MNVKLTERLDVGLLRRDLVEAAGVVGQVGHVLVLGIAAERLQQHPEEVGVDSGGCHAGSLLI